MVKEIVDSDEWNLQFDKMQEATKLGARSVKWSASPIGSSG